MLKFISDTAVISGLTLAVFILFLIVLHTIELVIIFVATLINQEAS